MKIALPLVLLLASSASSATENNENPPDRGLWERIDSNMTSIQEMTYMLTKQERILPNQDLAPAETFLVKFRKPYDLFMDVVAGPNEGRHYLYRSGWPYLKVHVFGKMLQWMVPKIPPISKLALRNNHHAITDAGYDATGAIVRRSLLRNLHMRQKDPTHPAIQIDPTKEVTEDGVPCLYFRSVNPEVYETYTVTKDDKTIFDIAKKLEDEPYLIIYYNADKVRSYDDLKVGEQLRVPMYYGKVSEFWVDKQTLLLRHIRVTDFFGKLYEDYQYRNIVTGAEAHLSDKDFDPENPDYGGF
jgi:hypothetical protein